MNGIAPEVRWCMSERKEATINPAPTRTEGLRPPAISRPAPALLHLAVAEENTPESEMKISPVLAGL
jgi:hypothetical protein